MKIVAHHQIKCTFTSYISTYLYIFVYMIGIYTYQIYRMEKKRGRTFQNMQMSLNLQVLRMFCVYVLCVCSSMFAYTYTYIYIAFSVIQSTLVEVCTKDTIASYRYSSILVYPLLLFTLILMLTDRQPLCHASIYSTYNIIYTQQNSRIYVIQYLVKLNVCEDG